MGMTCCESEADRTARLISQKIDAQLRERQKDNKREMKLLLLGKTRAFARLFTSRFAGFLFLKASERCLRGIASASRQSFLSDTKLCRKIFEYVFETKQENLNL